MTTHSHQLRVALRGVRTRSTLAWLPLLFALSGGCSSDTPPALTVTLQKWDSGKRCFATLPGGDTLGAGVPVEPCDPSTDTKLIGGVDQLRVVISYGNLTFDASTQPPTPTVSMTLDGVDTPPLATTTLAQHGPPTVFYAVLPVPARPVGALRLAASVTPGFSRDPIGPFSVDTPSAVVTVQDCASMAAGACELTAGVSSATVSVTAPGTAATTGTLTWTLSSILQPGSVPIAMSPLPNISNQLSGVAFVPVPVAPNLAPWRLTALVGAAVGATDNIQLDAPSVTVTVEQCADQTVSACALQASVGSAAVDVSMPGDAEVTGTINSSVGGIRQPGDFPISMKRDPQTAKRLKGVAFVPVPAAATPAAPKSTAWLLTAQVASASASAASINLTAPDVTAKIPACKNDSCTAASSVQLNISVPLEMAAKQATVSATVDQTASPLLTVDLTSVDVANDTLSGTTTLIAPKSGSTWTINVNVGGYNAQSLVLTVP